jgi:polysaccharide export outer membrane protein
MGVTKEYGESMMWGRAQLLLRTLTASLLVAIAFNVAGCSSALFPAAGPNSAVVRSGKSESGQQYALVKLTPEVVNIMDEYGPGTLSAVFGDERPPPEVRFGIGDVVSVTIFEAAAGGLFIPTEAGVRPGNFITLPNQPIDTAGNITVPYAGAVRAQGRTPSQVQQDIVDRIKDRAIEPQAVVALVTQNTSLITVIGEVNNAFTPSGRIPAQPAGERLLDVITRAGGLKDQGQNTWVVLERHGRRASAPFGSLVFEPQNNIWAWPGDTIYLYQEPQTFLAFGASGVQGQFSFNQWRITLAEAVGEAGGLLDLQADPGSVFLYRREPRELAEKFGVDCSRFDRPTVPIVYSVSFKDPGGYFLATRLQMHNKDLLFAANAETVEVDKFLNFIQNVAATANGVITTGINVQTYRIDSHTH